MIHDVTYQKRLLTNKMNKRRISRRAEAVDVVAEPGLAAVTRAQELGLMSYKDLRLPPLTEEEMSQEAHGVGHHSLAHSILAFVPFTQAWYEARTAEDEFNNYAKIVAEKENMARHADWIAAGREREVLSKMMADSNHDLFYFNQLRTKLLQNQRTLPSLQASQLTADRRLTQTSGFQSKGRKSSSAAIVAVTAESQRRLLHNCGWRGIALDGRTALLCTNRRMAHPYRRVRSPNGDFVPEILSHCVYHTPFCVGRFHVTASRRPDHVPDVRIRRPNVHALCSECYRCNDTTLHDLYSCMIAPWGWVNLPRCSPTRPPAWSLTPSETRLSGVWRTLRSSWRRPELR
jgi:hypothetical protein